MTRGALAGVLVRGALAAACSAAATLAWAQAPGDIVVEGKEPAIRCLIVPSRAIEYPADAAAFKESGVVRVRLTFAGGEERPQIDVFRSTDDRFRALVLAHVGGYRMPCLQAGESRVVTQEFQFVPGDGRTILTGEPRPAERREKVVSCVTTPAAGPAYPRLSSRSEPSHGRVLARAEFTAADSAPNVSILFNGGNARFEPAVRSYMAQYRVPCLGPSELPLVITQTFHFRLEGEPARVLKDASLATFVRNVEGLEKQRVRFDFGTMGCPFDLHFVLWQPHAANVVREIERSDPNRRELIEWLRSVDLKAPKTLHDEIVGDSMTIAVPCGVLDLL